jgi:ethanolamine ammonia-lyase small subunit
MFDSTNSSMDTTDLPVPNRHTESPLVNTIRTRTPARILNGRCGLAYRTTTQLDLLRDHAFALDAVHAEIDLQRDLGGALIKRFGLFEARTQAESKARYLLRPDLGRLLASASRDDVLRLCPKNVDVQVVIGDGLSAAAVTAQVPRLLPLLAEATKARGWSFGRPFVVHHCRVGVMNDVGELLDPVVVILLIGERPGLATAESLSAYMAFRPRLGHTDAQRNLISNIHNRGVTPEEAAPRILALAEKMMAMKSSGVAVKEDRAIACAAVPPRLPEAAPPTTGPG